MSKYRSTLSTSLRAVGLQCPLYKDLVHYGGYTLHSQLRNFCYDLLPVQFTELEHYPTFLINKNIADDKTTYVIYISESGLVDILPLFLISDFVNSVEYPWYPYISSLLFGHAAPHLRPGIRVTQSINPVNQSITLVVPITATDRPDHWVILHCTECYLFPYVCTLNVLNQCTLNCRPCNCTSWCKKVETTKKNRELSICM